jgi:hypothetical protein
MWGVDYTFVAYLARNSNAYAQKTVLVNKTNQMWHGLRLKDISVQEMYHFLGILLKISLSPIDGGGYMAYFADREQAHYF